MLTCVSEHVRMTNMEVACQLISRHASRKTISSKETGWNVLQVTHTHTMYTHDTGAGWRGTSSITEVTTTHTVRAHSPLWSFYVNMHDVRKIMTTRHNIWCLDILFHKQTLTHTSYRMGGGLKSFLHWLKPKQGLWILPFPCKKLFGSCMTG